MQIFLGARDNIPDPQAGNARDGLGELMVVAFVSVLCGSGSCADMAEIGQARDRAFSVSGRDASLQSAPRHWFDQTAQSALRIY